MTGLPISHKHNSLNIVKSRNAAEYFLDMSEWPSLFQKLSTKALKDAAFLCFHPGIDTTTVVFETEDFLERVLPALGVVPNFVDMDLVEE